MNEVYESLMNGLQEAVDDARGRTSLARRKITVTPVKQYSAEEVKQIRKSTEMSQRLFAEYLGVSAKTVEAWEAGTNHPSGPSSRLLSMIESDRSFTTEYPFVKYEVR